MTFRSALYSKVEDMLVSRRSREVVGGQRGLAGWPSLGGTALLIAWFLIIFSGEVWGLDFEDAAGSVVLLSLVSIFSCFVVICVFNGVPGKARCLGGSAGLFVAGGLLFAATVGVAMARSLSLPVFVTASCVVGCSGAPFVCAAVRQIARFEPRQMAIVCSVVLLTGVLIYSFVFYIPQMLRVPMLCLLPLLAGGLFAVDTWPVLSDMPSRASSGVPPLPDGESQRYPAIWRSVIMLSVFMLFSCIIRGYLPYLMDNVSFSYIRGFSIILILVAAATVAVVAVFLPARLRLSAVFRWVLLSGVVFFAIVPVFGLHNPIVLALTDAYRALCALLAIVYLASMSRQLPFFGFRVVGGALALYCAFGGIGWAIGAALYYSGIGSDALRVISSLQCVLVLLAFILLFRQAEIARFVDEGTVGDDILDGVTRLDNALPDTDATAGALGDSAVFNDGRLIDSGGGQAAGRWRTHCAAIAREHGLTEREEEVFVLLAKGYKVDNIAEELTVSYNTVRAHIRSIYQKCGIHSQKEFIALVNSRTQIPLSSQQGDLNQCH
jgi:DNA-binding CsgD family transcriptional regulator